VSLFDRFQKLKGRKSLADYGITVGSQGLNRLAALAVSVLVARMLGAEDFGIYSLFFAIFIMIYQAQSGANIAYVRFAKIREPQNKAPIIRISLVIQLIIAFSLIIGGWPAALLLSEILSLGSPVVLFFGFVSSGFLSLFKVWFGIYQERGQFGRLGVCSFAFNYIILFALFGTWVFWKNLTIQYILMTYLTISGVMGLASAFSLWKSTDGTRIEKTLFYQMWKMTAMNMAVTISYFLYRFVDVFFIKYYLDLQAVGMYSAAMKTSMLLNVLTGALPTVLLPKAIGVIKSPKCLRRYLVKSYSLSFFILVLFAGFFFVSPYILEALFGEKYTAAAPILSLLVLSWAANVLYIPIMQLFYAINRVGLRLIVELFKLTCSILLFMAFIPRFGAIGSAWALLVAITLSLILGYVLIFIILRKHYSTNRRQVEFRETVFDDGGGTT